MGAINFGAKDRKLVRELHGGDGLDPRARRSLAEAGQAEPSPTFDASLFLRIATLLEDAYYQTDDTGRIVHVSPAYEPLWGQGASQLRGEDWFHSVHREDLAQANEARLLLLNGARFDQQYRIVRGDGTIRWIRDRAILLRQPTRQIVGVARDVTAERERHEERRRARELDSGATLASSITHDFGNLLQGVMGCLNAALRAETSPEGAREYTQHALQAVRRGATLVRQLMQAGRKESVQPRVTAIDTAVTRCSTLLKGLLGDDIQLDVEARAPHGTILADPAQIEQILLNLAANARDAMPEGGKLLIKTAEVHLPEAPGAGSFVQLEVRDIGCGMDGATKGRIFEPFFTTKAAGKGTGLGLAAVRSVTRGLGGQVKVESEIGHGSAFILHFPLVAALHARLVDEDGSRACCCEQT
jgi:PAS domain S-box-containing protein